MSKITIGIIDEFNFCLMMPPAFGDNIGNTEGTSLSLCIGQVVGSDSAGSMPQGNSSI
jgi:hypothetical protein